MLRRVSVTAMASAVVMAVSTASASGPQMAQRMPQTGSMMHTSAEVGGPSAFTDFCRRTPKECEPDSQPTKLPVLNAEHWNELVQINDIVNQTVAPRSDQELYGYVDYWTIAGRYGDCEDYALTKQQMLRERGWPMNALLITVVRDENGEGHAVLTARTTRGDYILDNRQPQIVAWTQTPYQFIKRQSTLSPRDWLALEPGLAPPNDAAVAALPLTRR